MKKITVTLLAIALLIGSGLVQAANDEAGKSSLNKSAVQGTIVDQLTQETLAGVEVQVEGTNLKTYTDLNGNFSFENMEPGDYQINVKMISYKGKTEKLSLRTGKTDCTLQIEAIGK